MAAVSIVLAAVVLGACNDKPANVDAAPAQAAAPAMRPAATGGLSTRLIEYKNKLQQDPFSADARFGLGAALLEQGNPRAAEAELTRALELGFDKNAVLPPLARTWNLLGRSKALIENHANTVLSDPVASAELKSALAWAYVRGGDAKSARAMVEAALKDDPKSARARVLMANIAMSDGKVDEALSSLEQTLTEHPQAAEAWELKGDILLLAKSQVAPAMAAYEQALRVDPLHLSTHAKLVTAALDNEGVAAAQLRLNKLMEVASGTPPALYLSAKLALAKRDAAGAREFIQRALTEYPKDLRSLILGAEIELQLGSLRAAEEHLSNALTIAPTLPRVRYMLAQTYIRLASPDKAQVILEPLLRLKAPDATALGLSAEAALQAGLSFKAMRLFELAAAADPKNTRYRTVLALNRIAKGEVEGGFAELESAAAADPTSYADQALLAAKIRKGDLKGAEKAAQRLVTKFPDKALTHLMLGRVKFQSADLAAARRHFERAIELDPAFLPATLALAELELSARQPAKAKQHLQSLLGRAPNNMDALLAMSAIERNAGEPTAKLTANLEKLVQMHPDKAKPRLALINHLLEAGEATAALQAAQSASTRLVGDLNVADALGRAQFAAGESAQALTTFRTIVSARPRAPEPVLRMADVYFARNEIDSALEYYKRAVALRPGSIDARIKVVGLATVKKNWSEALLGARDVQRIAPADPRGYHLEGLVYAAQRQWDPAITAFRAGLKRGKLAETAIQLHTALVTNKKVAEAARFSAEWIAQNPRDYQFIGYQGEYALAGRDFAAAEGHFRAVVKGDERNSNALNQLAIALSELGKPEALAFAQRAAELKPGNAEFMNTVAMIHFRQGSLSEALVVQKRAVEMSPKTPLLRLNLARLAVSTGDIALARANLDVLSAMGKDFPAQAAVWELRQKLPQ